MNAPLFARACLFALLATSPLRAADPPEGTPPPEPLVPEYELTVADGARLRTMFRENGWAKDFTASNLYRGTVIRLGPVLAAVAQSDADGWKGRLGDFLADRLLEGRPVKLSYFHAAGLVSPFGLSLPGLSPRERDVLQLLIKGLRSGDDVATAIADGNGGAASVRVVPLSLRLQKFALVATDSCLALSRDPRVAATLSRSCPAEPRLGAATLDVSTGEFFAAWSAVLTKLFGVGPRLRVTFDWDRKGARFTPTSATLALAKDHILGTAPMNPAILSATPADVLFLTTAVLPDPGELSRESVEAYFRAGRSRTGATYVPVTLVAFGMRSGEKDQPEAMSALLVPYTGPSDRALADLDALFNRRGTWEVHASRACPGVVALSPSKAALERIADACTNRKPSFRQVSPKIVDVFTRTPLSTGAFLNVGGFLRSALLWGWQRETPPDETKREGPPPPPKELADAMRLLDRLPMYAFAGRVVGDAVVMKGVEP
ncbi:MAG: hypothetical protein ACHQPI_09405 [Thermoanaerobaculia bacterium]